MLGFLACIERALQVTIQSLDNLINFQEVPLVFQMTEEGI